MQKDVIKILQCCNRSSLELMCSEEVDYYLGTLGTSHHEMRGCQSSREEIQYRR
jgi:hypothetical protein